MFPCQSCTESLPSTNNAQEHPKFDNVTHALFSCSTCGLHFISKNDCGGHMTSNQHWASVRCQVCDAKFASTWACGDHAAAEHPEWPQLLCDTTVCGLRFHSYLALMKHMDDADHWAQLAFECTLCASKSFQSAMAYRQHMGSVHPEWPPQKCDCCSCRFATQDLLAKHMDKMDHHQRAVCEDCGKTFMNQQACNSHKTTTGHAATTANTEPRSESPPHTTCNTCNTAFMDLQACKNHKAAKGHASNTAEGNAAIATQGNEGTAGIIKPLSDSTNRSKPTSNDNNEKTVPCPYCDRKFQTFGGVGSHLESRGCHPELSHEIIWRAILERKFLDSVVLPGIKSMNDDDAPAVAITTT